VHEFARRVGAAPHELRAIRESRKEFWAPRRGETLGTQVVVRWEVIVELSAIVSQSGCASVCVDNNGFVKYRGLAVVEYVPRSKIPIPLGGWPSSHCQTLVIISSLRAVAHVRELGRKMLTGNDLACTVWTIRTRNDSIKRFSYGRHWRVRKIDGCPICTHSRRR
jgi:hypothetical protein